MDFPKDFVQFSDPFQIVVGGQFDTFHTTDFQRFDWKIYKSDWALASHEVPDTASSLLTITPFRINRNVRDRRETSVSYERVIEFVESNNGYFMGTYGLISSYLRHKKMMRKTGMRFISPEVRKRLPIVCRPSVRHEPIDEIPYILGAEWDQFQYGSIQADPGVDLGLDGHCAVLLFQNG